MFHRPPSTNALNNAALVTSLKRALRKLKVFTFYCVILMYTNYKGVGGGVSLVALLITLFRYKHKVISLSHYFISTKCPVYTIDTSLDFYIYKTNIVVKAEEIDILNLRLTGCGQIANEVDPIAVNIFSLISKVYRMRTPMLMMMMLLMSC